MPFFQQLHSVFNSLFFKMRSTLKLSRHGYTEKPCHRLVFPSENSANRIEFLKSKYQVSFENDFATTGAIENYHYLDLLDSTFTHIGIPSKMDGTLIDVGSKNFCYGAALNTFFSPRCITGIELDGYKPYFDGHSRYDYAQYYASRIKNAAYHVMDFCDYKGKADIVTCFYPFVVPEPLLSWTLPLKFFKPESLFAHMAKTLDLNGMLIMINQGQEEAAIANLLAQQSGLHLVGKYQHDLSLGPTNEPPFVSVFIKVPLDNKG